MKRRYNSKVSVLIGIIFIGTPLLCILAAIGEGSWISWLVALFTTALLLHSYFQTYYEIDGKQGTLYIQGGFLVREKIALNNIRKITESNSVLSAPALSIDRLEIHYNKYDSQLISPKNKKEFIAHIQELNPEIEYVD
ncbi:PH domain-containing protein [Myroides sp. DW712]|uniref:PH domain-containing protein n=1 Tax=Myroides sp. DW712 TaxID=3389800 RepID=UPI00397DAB86